MQEDASEGTSRQPAAKSEAGDARGDTERLEGEQLFGPDGAKTNIQIDPNMEKGKGSHRKGKVEFLFDDVDESPVDSRGRSKGEYNFDKTPTFADPRHARAFPDE